MLMLWQIVRGLSVILGTLLFVLCITSFTANFLTFKQKFRIWSLGGYGLSIAVVDFVRINELPVENWFIVLELVFTIVGVYGMWNISSEFPTRKELD